MNMFFAETLRERRTELDLTQQELAERMYVTRSTVARWENGSRLPDAMMILRLAKCLGMEAGMLLRLAAESDGSPNVILVDDSRIILTEGIAVLEEVLPNATVTGFTRPMEATEYARLNPVSLAILDIELGISSGLELSRELLDINPRTNIVFLTAYPDYALDAWNTGACGFLLKPMTPEGIKAQLKKLRYPLTTGGAGE